ncbi:uncharacterized protein LOC132612179 [Lycium barbarum]|uniref:uncharacterized protein LOC132612179 n=1 Tax=Lycium barbarum TaxID=112863 RepID=UPI00293E79C6|nr:uncharacterized protein LOC132612179 [Lycium barbarum]
MPGRPKKKRNKDADEPKKKFGKATRKGRKMTCSVCNTMRHNKEGCPIAKSSGASSSTAAAGATNATTTVGPVGATNTAATAGPTAATATDGGSVSAGGRDGAISDARGGGRGGATTGASASASGATTSTPTNAGANTQKTQSSTQQSTSTAGPKKKTYSVRSGGTNPGYKKPPQTRSKRPRAARYGVLFGEGVSVIERTGTTDRVVIVMD